MSERHEDHDPAPVPVKVVDRRFWARGESAGEGAEAGERRPALPTVLAEMEQRLKELQARERELLVLFRQGEQESEAFRDRVQRDMERRLVAGKAELFRGVLEVADNLERALLAAGADSGGSEVVRGVDQVLSQLRRLMLSQGVEEIEVAGLPFDPAVAEAVEVRDVAEADLDGVVVEVARRGYRYAGQTLRPARVAVGRHAARS